MLNVDESTSIGSQFEIVRFHLVLLFIFLHSIIDIFMKNIGPVISDRSRIRITKAYHGKIVGRYLFQVVTYVSTVLSLIKNVR